MTAWSGAAIAMLLVSLLGVEPPRIVVRLDSDQLRVTAPGVRFLTGQALQRLENGATVVFPIQLTLLTDNKNLVRHRTAARFAISFDLWEERFSAVRLNPPRRSASHLTAVAAESWCLENLPLPVTGLVGGAPFWVRLEVRAEEAGLEGLGEDSSSFSLARLVELFSRPVARGESSWRGEAGPLRLAELKKQ
jgi:hypothetical protein